MVAKRALWLARMRSVCPPPPPPAVNLHRPATRAETPGPAAFDGELLYPELAHRAPVSADAAHRHQHHHQLHFRLPCCCCLSSWLWWWCECCPAGTIGGSHPGNETEPLGRIHMAPARCCLHCNWPAADALIHSGGEGHCSCAGGADSAGGGGFWPDQTVASE